MSASSSRFFTAPPPQPFDLQGRIISLLCDKILKATTFDEVVLFLTQGTIIWKADRAFVESYIQELIKTVEAGAENIKIFFKVRHDINQLSGINPYISLILARVLCDFAMIREKVDQEVLRMLQASAGKLGGANSFIEIQLYLSCACRYLNAFMLNEDGELEIQSKIDPHEFGDIELSTMSTEGAARAAAPARTPSPR